MKQLITITVLFISGLSLGFAASSEFNFKTSGFNQKFTQDTLDALDAAYLLTLYSKMADDERVGEILEDKELLTKANRPKRAAIIAGILSGRYGQESIKKLYDVQDRIVALYRDHSDDTDFDTWVRDFASAFKTRLEANEGRQMRNIFIEKIKSVDSYEPLEIDVEKQKGIIDAYNNKYIEILKVLGCDGENCTPRKKNKFDL